MEILAVNLIIKKLIIRHLDQKVHVEDFSLSSLHNENYMLFIL